MQELNKLRCNYCDGISCDGVLVNTAIAKAKKPFEMRKL